MKVVALVSGGKDSCYAMMKCIQYGHQVVALANLLPADDSVDELDSYMYQTVGHQVIVSYAECMGVPLFRRRIRGSTRHQNLNYKMTPGDEVEDMYILLKEVKKQIPSITAVSSGAIASDYQRLRVESVCSRLGLISLAYLWKQDQSLLLQEMITNGIAAITVKVAALGLDPAKHLGKDLASLQSYLHKLKDLYGINVCGEGGEYETLTLDCPLFANARIVLDEFQIVLHSSDPIAPVGVLHPLAFHLESKEGSSLLNSYDKMGSVLEVQDDSLGESETVCLPVAGTPDLPEVVLDRLRICESKKDNTFSISCWLQDSCKSSAALQEDLEVVLKHIESQLAGHGFRWEHVLYIHLYIADMNEFTRANETYVKYITQDKCPFGVPSRSTIELPLLQAGLGKAYIEVLVANNQSKNVLHVQSISSWAPSCIGPYSQATLHNEILYMAGQLGLDPPTMTICNGGPAAEMEQALKNSEAVAKCFKCSISTSTILFVVYCSTRIPLSDRPRIQDKQELFLDKIKQEDKGSESVVVNPIYLYVLVPDLPKRAFVEVKPVIFISKDAETEDIAVKNLSSDGVSNLWGFHDAHWHGSCIQKCVVPGKLCTVVLSITNEVIPKICSNFQDGDENHQDHPSFLTEEHLERISKFCIYLLDKVIMENGFCWKDIMNWRIYFPTSLNINLETLSLIFANSFNELVEKGQRIQSDMVPVFNLVPVVGAGKSATSMDDIVTCELFARKS